MNKQTILITKMANKDGRWTITDEAGNTYSFFEKKQDGTFSKAYQFIANNSVKVGDNVVINYKVNGSYKNIMFFEKPKIGEGMESQPFQTPTEQKYVEQKQDEKWNEIARGKVRHGFSLEAFKLGMPLNNSTVQVIDSWVDYVMTGKISAERDTDLGTAPQQVETGEVSVSDVPF